MSMFNPKAMMKQQINNMIQANPQARQAWQTAKQMSQNKSPEEKRRIVENLARERGIPLDQLKQMAEQFGIQI